MNAGKGRHRGLTEENETALISGEAENDAYKAERNT